MDTIFALATAPGKAGVSVIRVSGPHAFDVSVALAGGVPGLRRTSLRSIRSADGTVLDKGLVIAFPQGASFTGEDIVEFHLHGSVAVVSAVLRRIGELPGLRMAEAGEFTRRALENGRLDLTQVEALSDLIESETESQRRQAMSGLSGKLGDKSEEWRKNLVRAASLLEATIDFVDEDVPVDVSPEVSQLIFETRNSIAQELLGLDAAERIRMGFEVAIVGPPNVGKSTLLNYLAGREAAITSDIAGTTRDVIEVRMDVSGLAVTFLDTAGLRETQDQIESLGIVRAKQRAGAADLRIHLVPLGDEPFLTVSAGDLILVPKDDEGNLLNGVSGHSGFGVSKLLSEIGAILSKRVGGAGLVNRERHRRVLYASLANLERSLELLKQGPSVFELTSEELRVAIRGLEVLLGRVDVEHLLGEIFANFCIGK